MTASVSPDGTHAAMASRYPVRPDDELYVGDFTGTRFEPDEGLGVPFTNTKVHGWFDRRTALVSGPDGVLRRVTPGKPPATVRVIPDAHLLGVASHVMTRFAWTTVSADDRWVLHIASLRDARAREQTVELGKGFLAYCAFAPGDRTLGCEVAQAMPLGRPGRLDPLAERVRELTAGGADIAAVCDCSSSRRVRTRCVPSSRASEAHARTKNEHGKGRGSQPMTVPASDDRPAGVPDEVSEARMRACP